MKTIRCLCIAAAGLAAAPVAAQTPDVVQAVQAGQVGERYDGYMGIVGPAAPELQRQVKAVNIRRRNLYIELASRRNISPQLVGMATACQLLGQVTTGEAYMLSDGAWRHRAPGQAVPLPDYCR
ncbi:MAG TPA: YdbL family protein [Sphingomicrobium sp.]|nr:YdbL family protein [Sphingomicrobium sp.]